MKWRLTIQPRWLPLKSSRKKAKIAGEIQVKAGLVDPAHPNATKEELQAAWDNFIGTLERDASGGIQAIIDAPATESVGIGMIHADTFDTEAVRNHSADDLDEEISARDTEDVAEKKRTRRRIRGLSRKVKQPFELVQGAHDVMGVVFMEVQAARDLPPERNGRLFCRYS